jgi:hypothetical protein
VRVSARVSIFARVSARVSVFARVSARVSVLARVSARVSVLVRVSLFVGFPVLVAFGQASLFEDAINCTLYTMVAYPIVMMLLDVLHCFPGNLVFF